MAIAKIYNSGTAAWEPAIVGKEGAQGIQGIQGEIGPNGVGVPAVGTDDQVLTVVSGAPAWADASGSGAWSLIFNGTLGGVTSTTVSGLSGYDEYYIDIPGHDRTTNLGFEYTYFRVNGQTSGYDYSLRKATNNGTTNTEFYRFVSSAAGQIILYEQAQTQPQAINIHITGGAGTGHCVMTIMASRDVSSSNVYSIWDGYAVAPLGGSALDSVTIFQQNAANGANGDIRIWGK
jgi:hypothetical protein